MSWLADGLTAGATAARRRLRVGRAQPARRRGRAPGPRGRRGPRRAGARGGQAARPRTRARRPHAVPARRRCHHRTGRGRRAGGDRRQPGLGSRRRGAQPLDYAAALSGMRDRVRRGGRVVYGDGIWSRSPTPEADRSPRRAGRRVRLASPSWSTSPSSTGSPRSPYRRPAWRSGTRSSPASPRGYATWLAAHEPDHPDADEVRAAGQRGSATPTSAATAASSGLALPPAARCVRAGYHRPRDFPAPPRPRWS